MPHCVVEHSLNIDSEIIVPQVYMGALESNLFEPDGSDIKVRAISYSCHQTGTKN